VCDRKYVFCHEVPECAYRVCVCVCVCVCMCVCFLFNLILILFFYIEDNGISTCVNLEDNLLRMGLVSLH